MWLLMHSFPHIPLQDDRSGLYANYTFSGDSLVEQMGYEYDTGNKYINSGVLLGQLVVLWLMGYRAVSRVVGSRMKPDGTTSD